MPQKIREWNKLGTSICKAPSYSIFRKALLDFIRPTAKSDKQKFGNSKTSLFTLSVCLSVCLSVYLSLSVSLCLFVSLSLSVSLCLCLCLCLCLSLSLYVSLSVKFQCKKTFLGTPWLFLMVDLGLLRFLGFYLVTFVSFFPFGYS